jgi:hypothetical protein
MKNISREIQTMNATAACAYLGMGYLAASLLYLLFIPVVGSPLRRSMTPEQRTIARHSSTRRLGLFAGSAVAAAAVLAVWRPFR